MHDSFSFMVLRLLLNSCLFLQIKIVFVVRIEVYRGKKKAFFDNHDGC